MQPPLSAVRAALHTLARDTLSGHAAFILPGPDAYSLAQGASDPEPGGVAALVPDFLLLGIDFYLQSPDLLARPITAAVAPRLGDVRPPLALAPGDRTIPLGEALGLLLDDDEPIPVSIAVALLLNFIATQVNRASVSGPFLAPYTRLTFAEKAEVFRRLEDPSPELTDSIAAEAIESLRPALGGQLRYLGGVLLEFGAIGSYIDWQIFDPRTRTVGERPISWRLTGFQPDGPVEGWDDFQGYYQGRRKVES